MEPSSSFEANAASNHNRAEHTDQAITGMDPTPYKAAAKGNIGYFENIHDPLDRFLTVNKNTILHIFISSIHIGGRNNSLLSKIRSYIFGLQDSDEERADPASAAEFVGYVLEKCPSLSLKANAEEETALHIAARYGHVSIVEVLINHEKSQHQDDDLESGVVVEASKEMLIGVNKKKDTALHEAVRNNHIEVVKLLIKKDPDFSYGANAAGETPLYLAVERHFPDLVAEILRTLKSPAYDGPRGRTALHAAAFYDDEEMTENILKRHGALSKQADHKKGWTPLHVAAYMNNIKATRLLLKHDRELAYIKDVDGRTALHIAAQRINNRVTKEIVSMCPDCRELLDQTGRNALHDLAAKGHLERTIVKMILKNPSSLQSLFNDQKDAYGNTPLHVHCKAFEYDQGLRDSPGVNKRVFKENSQLDTNQIASTEENLPTHELGQKTSTQKNSACSEESEFCLGQSSLSDIKYDDHNLAMKIEDHLKEFDKVSQAHLLVAALIATVTFAAGISIPGGFVGVADNRPPGSPVLWNTKGLTYFLVFDSISFLLSSFTVSYYLVYISVLGNFLRNSKLGHYAKSKLPAFVKIIVENAFEMLYIASVFMMLAFFMALFVVEPHSKLRQPMRS